MKKLLNGSCKLVLLSILFFPITSLYAEPPEIATYIGNKPPLGTGTVSVLFTKLYDVTMWTKDDHWSWDTTFVLQLKYAKNFTWQEIVDASIDEMTRLHNIDETARAKDRKVLENIFPDVKPGDTISAVYLPGKSLLFFNNGHQIGEIKNMKLAHQFLDIWLSEQARFPELRNDILKLSHS